MTLRLQASLQRPLNSPTLALLVPQRPISAAQQCKPQPPPTAGKLGAKALLFHIQHSKDASVAVRLLSIHADSANSIHVAATFHRCAKLSSDRRSRPSGPFQARQEHFQRFLYKTLHDWTAEDVSCFDPWELSTVIWSLGALRLYPKPKAWALLLGRLMELAPQLSPQGSALTLWSLHRLSAPYEPQQLLRLLAAQAPQWPSYPPRALAMTCQALAKLKPRLPAPLADQLRTATAQQLYRFSPGDQAAVLLSLATLQVPLPDPWLARWVRASASVLPSLTSQAICSTCTALARLRYKPSQAWLYSLYDQLYWTADQLPLRELAGVLWGLGKVGAKLPSEVAQRLTTFASVKLLESVRSAEAAASKGMQQGGAAGKGKHWGRRGKGGSPVSGAAVHLQQQQQRQEEGLGEWQEVLLSDEAWAEGGDASRLVLQPAGAAVTDQAGGLGAGSKGFLDEPPGKGSGTLTAAVSAAWMGSRAEETAGAAAAAARVGAGGGMRPWYPTQELSLVLHGVAACGWQPSEGWVDSMLQLVLKTVAGQNPQGLSMCLTALADLGASVDEGQSRRLRGRMLQLLPKHTLQSKVQLLHALVRMGAPLPAPFVMAWVKQHILPELPHSRPAEVCALLQSCGQLQLGHHNVVWRELQPRLLELAPGLSAGSLLVVVESVVAWGKPRPSEELQGLMVQRLEALDAQGLVPAGVGQRFREGMRSMRSMLWAGVERDKLYKFRRSREEMRRKVKVAKGSAV